MIVEIREYFNEFHGRERDTTGITFRVLAVFEVSNIKIIKPFEPHECNGTCRSASDWGKPNHQHRHSILMVIRD